MKTIQYPVSGHETPQILVVLKWKPRVSTVKWKREKLTIKKRWRENGRKSKTQQSLSLLLPPPFFITLSKPTIQSVYDKPHGPKVSIFAFEKNYNDDKTGVFFGSDLRLVSFDGSVQMFCNLLR